jgi:hypothetical protein
MLLQKCGHGSGDRVVLAGDLVAKGPDSQAVVQFARENGVLAVLGNHDAFALAHRHQSGKVDRSQGRRSYIAQLLPDDWTYLEGLPLFLRIGQAAPNGPEYVVVHAGAVPGVPLEQQKADHLLSIRSIDDTGSSTSRLLVHFPWAAKWHGPEALVFGHDAVRGLQQMSLATGIDTGCVYGRMLTALVLPEGQLIQVPAIRRYDGR